MDIGVPDRSMWEAVASRGSTVRFGAGDVLMHHGESSRHCYAILHGDVLVSATSTQGATVILGRRGPGSLVGELAALERAPRSATVRAVTDVEAVVLGADALEVLLREQPDLALAQLRRLSLQLRELTERYALRSEDLRARLVGLLLTHAAATGDPAFRSTREELAGWVGATREAVIRTLRELEADGVVVRRRGAVEVRASR